MSRFNTVSISNQQCVLLLTIPSIQKNKNNSAFQLAIMQSFLFAELGVTHTVQSRFFEYSIIRNSRFFEPKVVSLGFASVKHCNFTPGFSNARFFETPDISNSFFLPFKNLHSISRTLKTQEPTKTGFSHKYT